MISRLIDMGGLGGCAGGHRGCGGRAEGPGQEDPHHQAQLCLYTGGGGAPYHDWACQVGFGGFRMAARVVTVGSPRHWSFWWLASAGGVALPWPAVTGSFSVTRRPSSQIGNPILSRSLSLKLWKPAAHLPPSLAGQGGCRPDIQHRLLPLCGLEGRGHSGRHQAHA